MSQQRATIHQNLKAAAFGLAACTGAAFSVPAAALDLSIYGVGHLSADKIDIGTNSSSYLHSNSSRLGFKGSHDLGNGLSVLAQYESGVDLTGNGTGDGNGGASSNGQIFTRARDSFIGVRGGFGTVRLGRLPALNEWLYDYNLFADQVGDLGNIWGGDGLPGRSDHAVSYRTPNFRGFSLGLTYVPTQGGTNTSSYIAKGDYANGGLKLGVAYANFNKGATGTADNKAEAVTGSYDFGAFNIGAGWQRETGIGALSGADRNKYTLGAGVKAGSNGMVKAQYARAGDVNGIANSDAKQWAVGYDHAWDKNTTLYVAYAKTRNGAAAAYTSYDYGHGDQGVPTLVAGNSPSALSIGVVYKFDLGILPR
jgi:predicted porin